jgi:phytoene synthase
MRAAAEELPGTVITVDEAYAVCEEITRLQAKNFAYGIRLLPASKRRALSAVYALARRIDDVGDGDLPVAEKLAGLEAIRADLRAIEGESGDPVLVAIRDVASRYPLPLSAFDELIQGCEMDCKGVCIRTFEELVQYCRLVAGTIGRLSVAIFGVPDFRAAEPLADALGVALQLTNILRDVREDKERMGRVYLPGEDLLAHGCSLDLELCAQGLPGLILFEAGRAKSWYDEGLSLLPLLDRRSRACVATMAGIYRRLLGRIEADPGLVLTTRVSLPVSEKLGIAARALAVGKV